MVGEDNEKRINGKNKWAKNRGGEASPALQ